MPTLNFKHLRYFWAVAKSGSIARASEQLHLTAHAISSQISELENTLGAALFRRVGRGLELTDLGRRILSYADEIFSLGDELLEVVRDQSAKLSLPFRVGISDSIPKIVAYRLIEPALKIEEPIRLICREGRLTALLAELSVHHLDMVITDRPMPGNLNVRAYSHLLGESEIVVCGTPGLIAGLSGSFPQNLDGAPFLLPGEDFAIRGQVEKWFSAKGIHPRVVGEFDDSALLKAFGKAGAGFFFVPDAILGHVCELYGVAPLGTLPGIREQLFAITTERRITHPAIVAIHDAARQHLFGSSPTDKPSLSAPGSDEKAKQT